MVGAHPPAEAVGENVKNLPSRELRRDSSVQQRQGLIILYEQICKIELNQYFFLILKFNKQIKKKNIYLLFKKHTNLQGVPKKCHLVEKQP